MTVMPPGQGHTVWSALCMHRSLCTHRSRQYLPSFPTPTTPSTTEALPPLAARSGVLLVGSVGDRQWQCGGWRRRGGSVGAPSEEKDVVAERRPAINERVASQISLYPRLPHLSLLIVHGVVGGSWMELAGVEGSRIRSLPARSTDHQIRRPPGWIR